MHDNAIIELFFSRSEQALRECSEKYSAYMGAVAVNILGDMGDADECVNDALYRAWNAIPPARPENLATYLGRITRNLAINRFKQKNAVKRGGQAESALSELDECLPSSSNTEEFTDEAELRDSINRFLSRLRPDTRRVFVRRYWYLSPIKDIAREYRMTESRVKSTLFRTRRDLKKHLEKEGIII